MPAGLQPRIFLEKGQRFHSLVFTGEYGRNDKGRRCGWFLCDCGNKKLIPISRFTCSNPTVKACGCTSYNLNFRDLIEKYGEDYPFYVVWGTVKVHMSRRKKDFTITPDDIKRIWMKQNGRCIYTGEKLHLPNSHADKASINLSIDRIDSSIGYLPDNIQFTTKRVNMMKQELSHSEFLHYCKLIAINN